jgi:SAM-dependent methyltransferase
MKTDVKELYDGQAKDWSRQEPVLLSDYSARPFVMELCEPLNNLRILDAGCGEGYVGRKLLERGAQHVHGIDISEKMIEQAISIQAQTNLKGATYEALDIREAAFSEGGRYDLALGMFLFNYLNVDDTHRVMKKLFEVLKPGGHFIFSVPHPFLAFLKKDKYPFYFEPKGGYFSARNVLFPGEIWRRDGISVGVQCVHKTFEDYFSGLKNAGFTQFPEIYELRITDEHVQLDPDFFTPLVDLPLHVAFKIKK